MFFGFLAFFKIYFFQALFWKNLYQILFFHIPKVECLSFCLLYLPSKKYSKFTILINSFENFQIYHFPLPMTFLLWLVHWLKRFSVFCNLVSLMKRLLHYWKILMKNFRHQLNFICTWFGFFL